VKDFSYFNRSDLIEKLEHDQFDLIIIGGGITGAGIALDAASRGMKTALVEKNDFASGTSSKSTKLIHGGLRYLKQFHIKMVADVGKERRIVHKLAPHLVLPEKMLLPVLKKGSMGMFSISIGLKLYDFLAGVKGDDRRKMLGKRSTLKEEPLLPSDRIKGSGLYAEYRTDDARLTIEIMKTAHQHGATCINYVEASDFKYDNGKLSGIECRDVISNNSFSIKGKHIINAAGPWVDEIRALNKSRQGKQLYLTKGVHLVVPKHKLRVHHSMYFEVQDGRMIFLIPRNQITYIGTTDTPYDGDKDMLKVDKEDASYLINAVNEMFPEVDLTINDIESSWSGLRPLIYEEGKSASEISRKDEIFISSSGLVSMAGGKLTGYRKMAKKVVNKIAGDILRKTGKKYDKCRNLKIPLNGNDFINSRDVSIYIREITSILSKLNIPEKYASYLVHNYGKQTGLILKQLDLFTESDPELKLLKSELAFCLDAEMVCRPLDFLERRTGRLYFWIGTVDKYKKEILATFKEKFGWSASQFEDQEKILTEAMLISKTFN
jgi:glycerol-3-phosphate dehydrogenase